MAKTSIREIARSLGLSHTTVSEALRHNPRVNIKTRERVLKAAEEAGYNYNPLAGALMSEMRRSGAGTFRGVVAIIDLDGNAHRNQGARRYHNALTSAAAERAKALGFKADIIVLGDDKEVISINRLNSILLSRGIHGIILLPVASTPDIQKLDWKNFAGIYLDYLIDRPALDSICSDHFRSMVIALQKLAKLGYRRPGFVLHEPHDYRLLYRWEAAYNTYISHNSELEAIKPYISTEFDIKTFTRWFKKGRPDVVLSHHSMILDWMMEAGAKVPETHGFCSLNVLRSAVPAAGLDLRPDLIGSRGMELLIGQLHRNQFGIPETPAITTIPASWHDGPTLKAST